MEQKAFTWDLIFGTVFSFLYLDLLGTLEDLR